MFNAESFFRIKSEYNLRFGVVPKNALTGEDVIWIDTGKPGAIVHPLNAWEDHDGVIVLWTVMCENLVIDLETEDTNTFRMVEYKLDHLKNGGELIGMTVVDETVNVEFSIVPNMGQFNHYGYNAIQGKSTPEEGSFSDFYIWDKLMRTHLDLYYPKDEVGGEPALVEDDDQQNTYVRVYLFNNCHSYELSSIQR